MNLPRLFREKDATASEPRISTTAKVKTSSNNEAENGMFPARIVTSTSKKVISLTWKVTIISTLVIVLLSIFGYTSKLRDFINGFNSGSGGLIVSAEYVKANVYIDGKLLGQTPFTGENISAGKHKIKISAVENINDYFQEKEFDVNISEGNTTIIKLALAPSEDLVSYAIITPHKKRWDEETLVITGAPNGTKVAIDGAPMGDVPVETSSILEGAHQISLTAPGYKSMDIDVSVQPERSVTIDFNLYKYQLTLEEKNEN